MVLASPGADPALDGRTWTFEVTDVRDVAVVLAPGLRGHRRPTPAASRSASTRGPAASPRTLVATQASRAITPGGRSPRRRLPLARLHGRRDGRRLRHGIARAHLDPAGDGLGEPAPTSSTTRPPTSGSTGSSATTSRPSRSPTRRRPTSWPGPSSAGSAAAAATGRRSTDRSSDYSQACYYEIVYIQGGNVLDDLREAMGTDRFWAALHDYVEAHRDGLGGTRQLLEALRAASPVDLLPTLRAALPGPVLNPAAHYGLGRAEGASSVSGVSSENSVSPDRAIAVISSRRQPAAWPLGRPETCRMVATARVRRDAIQLQARRRPRSSHRPSTGPARPRRSGGRTKPWIGERAGLYGAMRDAGSHRMSGADGLQQDLHGHPVGARPRPPRSTIRAAVAGRHDPQQRGERALRRRARARSSRYGLPGPRADGNAGAPPRPGAGLGPGRAGNGTRTVGAGRGESHRGAGGSARTRSRPTHAAGWSPGLPGRAAQRSPGPASDDPPGGREGGRGEGQLERVRRRGTASARWRPPSPSAGRSSPPATARRRRRSPRRR